MSIKLTKIRKLDLRAPQVIARERLAEQWINWSAIKWEW